MCFGKIFDVVCLPLVSQGGVQLLDVLIEELNLLVQLGQVRCELADLVLVGDLLLLQDEQLVLGLPELGDGLLLVEVSLDQHVLHLRPVPLCRCAVFTNFLYLFL